MNAKGLMKRLNVQKFEIQCRLQDEDLSIRDSLKYIDNGIQIDNNLENNVAQEIKGNCGENLKCNEQPNESNIITTRSTDCVKNIKEDQQKQSNKILEDVDRSSSHNSRSGGVDSCIEAYSPTFYESDVNKSGNICSMDMHKQKICKILKEDAKRNKSLKKPDNSKGENDEKDLAENINFSKRDSVINTYRAYCNIQNCLWLQTQDALKEPPSPQFEILACQKALAQALFPTNKSVPKIQPIPAALLNITRSPIVCPESACQRMIFVSDFCKHLVVDHNQLPIERIRPFQCRSFFLDARLFQYSSTKCHLLYLMCDKICNLGSSEYKDFLPILVMTARIPLHQMCEFRNQASTLEYFLIWLTSITPVELPISASLTVWGRNGKVPSCHVVYSGQMYSTRNSQSAIDVWRSGHMLLLSSQQIKVLTNNGTEMLNLQVTLH